MHNRRHPQAALPAVALDAVEWAVAAEEGGAVLLGKIAFDAGTVVGGEHDQRIGVEIQVLEQLAQVADGIIDSPRRPKSLKSL